MEENLYANTLVVQLNWWTNSRNTLWFLAMLYTAITLFYAFLIHRHRNPTTPAAALPVLSQERQAEFVKMPPVQQQAFMAEYQQMVLAQQQQSPQQQSGCCGSRTIELYDTPLYEFVRIAWMVSGITAFVWTFNLFLSFWAFSGFYVTATTGPLQTFWTTYSTRQNATLIVVTVFLVWPLCSFVLEMIVFVVGFLPWLVIRNTCKSGVEGYRPSLPLAQLPGYIRADMFFMDFQDLKRLGFSRQAWIILTGEERPFFDACDDPAVDRDPAMTALQQQRQQWQQTMLMAMPPWARPPGAMYPGGMMLPPQQFQQPGGFSMESQPPSPGAVAAEYPVEDAAPQTRRRRHHRSRSREHRHDDPLASPPAEQTSLGVVGGAGGGGAESSRRRRHHRSRSRSVSKGALDGGDSGGGAASPAAESGGHRRRHRSHSRSRSKEVAVNIGGGASPTSAGAPAVAVPGGGSGGGAEHGTSNRHRRRSSRSRSKAGVEGESGGASPSNGNDGGHRHRRHSSHSRGTSKEKVSEGGNPGVTSLDALMQL